MLGEAWPETRSTVFCALQAGSFIEHGGTAKIAAIPSVICDEPGVEGGS
jgi:hypothetical protein